MQAAAAPATCAAVDAARALEGTWAVISAPFFVRQSAGGAVARGGAGARVA